MKRLLALLLTCLLPLPALAGGIPANGIPVDSITHYTDVPLAQIDAAVDELFAFSHTRGGTLVLGYGGEIIYARDYGDAATKTPVSEHTCFRLASVAKMVSALGVLSFLRTACSIWTETSAICWATPPETLTRPIRPSRRAICSRIPRG